ncbi:hypothetical protein [Clostridium sp. AM58-1XD]|uniref:hypothetical protein n=1 Tax=Clostridium sp. AM58-1XD TaxID=2292307 RepID=UPI000E4A741A|nr:hypothetical protein [Clostridium sp. AM58-1XD]RGY96556.1 hypothetical protein DXA13_16865 [Clostridium sp. AM58-1XD]
MLKMEFVYQKRADLRLERMTCFWIVIVTAVYMLLAKEGAKGVAAETHEWYTKREFQGMDRKYKPCAK